MRNFAGLCFDSFKMPGDTMQMCQQQDPVVPLKERLCLVVGVKLRLTIDSWKSPRSVSQQESLAELEVMTTVKLFKGLVQQSTSENGSNPNPLTQ